ncbi:MAG: hypothetical protein KDD60_09790, partial [Bdellovibrionales bacterium]|nr:hypothetical protein [Bdellovibrionales bacterium]
GLGLGGMAVNWSIATLADALMTANCFAEPSAIPKKQTHRRVDLCVSPTNSLICGRLSLRLSFFKKLNEIVPHNLLGTPLFAWYVAATIPDGSLSPCLQPQVADEEMEVLE